MTNKYLQDCLKQFPEVSKKRWGREFDLEELEKKVKASLNPERNQKDVSMREIRQCFDDHFTNTEHWWFDRYWVVPSIDKIDEKYQKKGFNFCQLSRENENKEEEKKFIEDLLGAFRDIGLVSIILRFICPDSFGILSPPVEYALNLRRGKTAVATYRNYLKDLREIRQHYEFKTAAEADKALWVLKHHMCDDKGTNGKRIKKAIEEDEFMLRLRAKNLVIPINELPLERLAIALYTVKNDLAALVACYALEKNAKKWAKATDRYSKALRLLRNNPDAKAEPSLGNYLEALPEVERLCTLNRGLSKNELLEIRNNIFHGLKMPQDKTIKKLVETVLKIGQRVNSLEKGKNLAPTDV